GRRRAVGEDVALVAAAARAGRLDAHHAVGDVLDPLHMRLVEGRPEGGPAGAALELGAVLEQRQAAEPAAVDAGVLLVEQPAAERRLGAVVQEDVGLLAGQRRLQALALLGRRRRQVESGWGELWRAHEPQSKVPAFGSEVRPARV